MMTATAGAGAAGAGARQVRSLLEQLPVGVREVVLHSYGAGRTQAQISAFLCLPEPVVRQRLAEGMRQLAALLLADAPGEPSAPEDVRADVCAPIVRLRSQGGAGRSAG